jgi:hypothetical protein
MRDYIIFGEDDDGYEMETWMDIKYPNQVSTQAYLFTLEYRHPKEYYDFLEDVDINGMIIANYFLIDGPHVVDAIKSGMLRPILVGSSTGDLHIDCQYWSPTEHEYKNYSDMSKIEIEWLHLGLVGRVWSYN